MREGVYLGLHVSRFTNHEMKFKLVIAYDGTAYEGWQVQKTGMGVQQIVEQALAKLFPSGPRLHSASRTDTGVHALGMVAHFEIPAAEFKMSARKLALALNAWLPEDIRVLSAARATKKFHARFDAAGKQYRYFVWNHAAMNPLLRHSAWQVTRRSTCRPCAPPRRCLSGGTISNRLPPAAITRWNPPCANSRVATSKNPDSC